MKQVIMMTKDGCGSCTTFKPLAKEIAEEYGYEFKIIPNPKIPNPKIPNSSWPATLPWTCPGRTPHSPRAVSLNNTDEGVRLRLL